MCFKILIVILIVVAVVVAIAIYLATNDNFWSFFSLLISIMLIFSANVFAFDYINNTDRYWKENISTKNSTILEYDFELKTENENYVLEYNNDAFYFYINKKKSSFDLSKCDEFEILTENTFSFQLNEETKSISYDLIDTPWFVTKSEQAKKEESLKSTLYLTGKDRSDHTIKKKTAYITVPENTMIKVTVKNKEPLYYTIEQFELEKRLEE